MIECIKEFDCLYEIDTSKNAPSAQPNTLTERCHLAALELFQNIESNFDKILPSLKERVTWIRNQKESYRFLAQASIENEPFFQNPASLNISTDSLKIPRASGVSGSYFLLDQEKQPCFVIKPNDEDCGCLHNPSGWGSLGMKSPIRDNMPLYQSALKEALTYQIAQDVGLSNIAPKTMLAVLQSDGFSRFLIEAPRPPVQESTTYSSYPQTSPGATSSPIDALMHLIFRIQDQFSAFYEKYLNYFVPYWLEKNSLFMDSEKLCSVQTFIPNAQPVASVKELTEDLAQIDPRQFEDCNILIWITNDTDAHGYNILSYPMSTDENGKKTYGIKKIDNGLTFPTQNQQLRNHLAYYPQMNTPLSEEGKEKIQAIDISSLAEKMRLYGIVESIPAMEERIALLKELAGKEGITLKEIHQELSTWLNFSTSY